MRTSTEGAPAPPPRRWRRRTDPWPGAYGLNRVIMSAAQGLSRSVATIARVCVVVLIRLGDCVGDQLGDLAFDNVSPRRRVITSVSRTVCSRLLKPTWSAVRVPGCLPNSGGSHVSARRRWMGRGRRGMQSVGQWMAGRADGARSGAAPGGGERSAGWRECGGEGGGWMVARWVVEPMTGIEPAYSAWEADVLPLNYIGAHDIGRP